MHPGIDFKCENANTFKYHLLDSRLADCNQISSIASACEWTESLCFYTIQLLPITARKDNILKEKIFITISSHFLNNPVLLYYVVQAVLGISAFFDMNQFKWIKMELESNQWNLACK